MKTSRAITFELNKVLSMELIGINQYFLHARMLKNWGFEALGKYEYDQSIEAMKSADDLISRVLFLEGLPNLQDLGKLNIGQEIPEILKSDLALASNTRTRLVEVMVFCEKESDFVSREILAKILEETEEQVDFLETQLELIAKMGLENYLQSAVKKISD